MKIYGHRGNMGHFPQNTLLSFEKAIEQGAHGIELDVHLSKDGEVVVIHDESLERTTNGTGFVKDFTLIELKQLDAGHGQTIPTLKEVYSFLRSTEAELNIELKTHIFNYEGIEEKVLSITKAHSEGRKVVYSSFHLPTILRIKALDASANIAWLLHNTLLSHPAQYIQALGLEALHLEKDMLLSNPEHYKDVYEKLRIWTVNNAQDVTTLLQLGVGAIISDFPGEMLKTCEF